MAICLFCNLLEATTTEHILAKSYYLKPDIDSNINLLTTPACYPCNQKINKHEVRNLQALTLPMLLNSSGYHSDFIDIVKSMKSSTNAKAGRGVKDTLARAAKKARARALVLPQSGNIGWAIGVPKSDLQAVFIKIAKGLEAETFKRSLVDYEFEFNLQMDATGLGFLINQHQSIMERSAPYSLHGVQYFECGKSLKAIRLCQSNGNDEIVYYCISIWDRRITCTVCATK